MKHPSIRLSLRGPLLVLLLWLGTAPHLRAAEEGGPSDFATMSAEQLREEWTTRLGSANFRAIDMPAVVRPGGNYGPRLFYFTEPAPLSLEGNAATGRLTIGGQTFDYSRAVSPLNEVPDSSITYYAIRSPQFDQIVDEQFGRLENEARTEDGKWNMAMIAEAMGIPPALNSYLQDWENLPNFGWVMSSILVRRASQQSGPLELVLQDGRLREYSSEEIVTGDGPKNAIIAALYNPASLEKVGSSSEYPLWMLLAAFGVGFILPLGFIMLRRPGRKRRDQDLAPDEMDVLEEDPRFLNIQRDLESAQEPMQLLKVLYTHFDDNNRINSLLAQTKISLDRSGGNASNSTSEKESSSSEAPQDNANEGSKEGKTDRKKAKIKIKSEDIRKKDSVETEVPQEEDKSPEKRAKDNPKQKEGRVREVVKEVERVVFKDNIDNTELLRRLENQETAEEKLQVAIAYWDSAYNMDGAINRELGTVLRSHRIYHKVKAGFEADNIRSGMSELALSFGAGYTTKVKHIMDRSEAVEQFVTDVEADRLAPEAGRDDERGRTAAHLAEIVRGLQFTEGIAKKNFPAAPAPITRRLPRVFYPASSWTAPPAMWLRAAPSTKCASGWKAA